MQAVTNQCRPRSDVGLACNSKINILPSTSACYFSDGRKIVDFVLAYERNTIESNGNGEDPPTLGTPKKSSQRRFHRRKIFEKNLSNMGLELEYVDGMVGYQLNLSVKFKYLIVELMYMYNQIFFFTNLSFIKHIINHK